MTTTSPAPASAFGQRLAQYFHRPDAPALSTTSFAADQLTAIHIARRQACTQPPGYLPAEDGFLCALQLAGRPGHALDTLCIHDLREELGSQPTGPLDFLGFHLPRPVLDEFADGSGLARVDHLSCEPGVADPVLAQLGRALLPALDAPAEGSQLFFDHLALAVCAHLLARHGGMRCLRQAPSGGLSSVRKRRAMELLASRLDGDISIAEVASACGLSRAHFTRAFRQSTGTTPHRWLQQFRVEKVKQMLVSTSMPIAEIAFACGFADQSHLTRTFTQLMRVAPAAWRRQ